MLHIGLLGLLIPFIIYVIYYLLFTLLFHMYGSLAHSLFLYMVNIFVCSVCITCLSIGFFPYFITLLLGKYLFLCKILLNFVK